MNGYEELAQQRIGTRRAAGCLVNINQNPEHMPTIGHRCPSLLRASRLWSLGLSRELHPQEHLELQGYSIFDSGDDADVYTAPHGMKAVFASLPSAALKSLAGNAMHLGSVGTAHAFLLIMMEAIMEPS